MLLTVLVIAVLFGSMWWLARLGARNTASWWLRDYFGKVCFYVAIFAGLVTGRQFEFPVRLVFSLTSSLFLSLLIAAPLTVIYYFRVVKKQPHLRK